MVVLLILKIIAAIATAVLGMVSFIRPRAIFSFTGLTAPEARGISEIRSIFGGLFIALGVLAIFLGEPGFQMLGISYLAVALARLFSMMYDKSYARSNIISLAFEVVFGVVLVI